MKNIEKIRNMSAEELARIFDGTKCDYCIYGDNNEPCGNCVKSIAEWLEQEAEKPSIFEPRKGDVYYYIDDGGRVFDSVYADIGLKAIGNVCTDKSVMERKAHELKLWSLLWNFAEENNDEMDWDDAEEYKYYIYKDCIYKRWSIASNLTCRKMVVYFSSRKLAQRAIDEIVLPWERRRNEY